VLSDSPISKLSLARLCGNDWRIVNAVLILFDHLFDAFDVALDAAQAADDLFAGFGVHIVSPNLKLFLS
jgi:hypothetical protein